MRWFVYSLRSRDAYIRRKNATIASVNGLSPVRRQAIIRINAAILSIRPYGTYFSEILFMIQKFSLKEMHTKISSTKCGYCIGLNVSISFYCDNILSLLPDLRYSFTLLFYFSMISPTWWHHNDVIMSSRASQIASLTIVWATVYSGTDQRKHQSSASPAFVWGIHRWPVNSPHKGPVTRNIFLFNDVIIASRANEVILKIMGEFRRSNHNSQQSVDHVQHISWGVP